MREPAELTPQRDAAWFRSARRLGATMGIFLTLVLYCIFIALHALFFKTGQRSWGQAMACWQGLYVVWFVLAVAIVERAHRWRWVRKLRRRADSAHAAN